MDSTENTLKTCLGFAVTAVFFCAIFYGLALIPKAQRKISWWLAQFGAILASIGAAVLFCTLFPLASGSNTSGPGEGAALAMASCLGLGLILFTAGFLGFGLRAGRTARRIAQLEQLEASMSAEVAMRAQLEADEAAKIRAANEGSV